MSSAQADDETADADEPVELEFEPTRVSSVVAMTAGVLAALTTVPYGGFAVPFGIAGLAFLATGLFGSGSRRWVSLGVANLFMGVIVAGGFGAATPPTVLAATVATLIAWDVGQHAITVGEQFGRTAPTRRGEVVHAASTTIVGVLSAGIAYGVYVFGTSGQPTLAVVLLFLGAVLLVWALRE